MSANGVPRTTEEWQALDSAHYLHPFTDHKALSARGSRIITRAEGVYVYTSDGQKILGLIVVAAEPTELTVVNIDGAIDPARVRELSGKFGIPKIDIDTKKSLKK